MMNIICIFILVFFFWPKFIFAEVTWIPYRTNDGIVDRVYALAIEGNYIWCGTNRGVVRWGIKDKTYKIFIAQDEFPVLSTSVSSIAIDNNGIKWFGLSSFGIASFDGITLKYFDGNTEGIKVIKEKHSLTSLKEVGSIAVTDSLVYVCFQAGYKVIYSGHSEDRCAFIIASYNGILWKEIFYATSITPVQPYSILSLGNNVWFLYYGMLYSIDSKTGSVLEQLNKTLFSVCAEGGELLWLGGRDFIVSYDWNTHTSKVYQNVLNGLNYSAITVSIDKEKWIGSNKGVTQYNGMSWINSAPSGWVYNGSENDDKVYALIPDSDGSIWAGTTKGLYKIQSQPLSVHESSGPSILVLNISPNPFNASTSIIFTLPASARAELAVYSATGQRIRTLATGPMAAGTHTATWDSRDENGRPVSSGVYVSRLESNGRFACGKMLLMK